MTPFTSFLFIPYSVVLNVAYILGDLKPHFRNLSEGGETELRIYAPGMYRTSQRVRALFARQFWGVLVNGFF